MSDTRWSAFVALWTAKPEGRDDGSAISTDLADMPWVKRLGLRLACTLALAMRRAPIVVSRGPPPPKPASSHSLFGVPLVWWDLRSDSAGWACCTLEFHPWQFRYSIDIDGDSYL